MKRHFIAPALLFAKADGVDGAQACVNGVKNYLLNSNKKPSLVGRGAFEAAEAWLRKAEQHLKDENGVP